MKPLRLVSYSIFLFLLVFSCEKRVCGCVFPPSPLAGNWLLTRITYGLTQKTVTAAEAGYSETLSFSGTVENSTFKQTRNGLPILSSHYSLSFPNGGSSQGFIYFQADSTQQSFRMDGDKLYLSDRTPRGATLADGSTYEYQRE